MMVRRLVLCLLAAVFAGSIARAAGPSFWVVSTQAGFLKGHSDGVSVDDVGRIAAGPTLATVSDLATPQVWSLAVAPDGTWYAGTGSDGRVIRGRGTQTDTVLTTTETNIHAIAVAPDGRVYVASSPDGRVAVIERDGTSRTLFDPTEKYIWALLVDRAGRLWIGAGNPAVIYRVDTDGTSHVVYHPSAAHVVSLALDGDGRVLAGTESPGRLYRIDAADHAFALLESGLAEVHAIQVARDGTIYAVALNAGDVGAAPTDSAAMALSSSSSSSSSSLSSLSSAINAVAVSSGSSSSAPASAPSGKKTSIYRIRPNGTWDVLWESNDAVYDLAIADDGTLIAPTGPDGRVYQIRQDGSSVLLTAGDAKEITRVIRQGNRYLLSSANPGRILSMSLAAGAAGTYLSPVRDAKSVATWGSIRWEAAGGVALYTRSGNTDKPDDSWGEWSAVYTHRDGDQIQSQAGRYLQWKAVFGATPGALTSVTIGYLAGNQAPMVSSITVFPAGAVFQRGFSGDDGPIAGLDDSVRRPGQPDAPPTPLGRRMFQKGLQTLQWKADDDDGDRLMYTLSYRREGETDWHELRAGLSDSIFVWDTTTVADGRYVVKVVASDAPSNTAERALTNERESEAFDIDNTPPVISSEIDRTGSTIKVNLTIRDAESAIDRVEYAIGGGKWILVYPADGVADSRVERYQIVVKSETDLARLVVRASDVMQNVTSQLITGK